MFLIRFADDARSEDVLIWTTALCYSLVLRTALKERKIDSGTTEILAVTSFHEPCRHPKLIKVVLIELIELLIYFLTLSGARISLKIVFISYVFFAGSQDSKQEMRYFYRRTDNVFTWQKYVLIRRQYFIHILFLSQKLDFDRHFHLAKAKYVIKSSIWCKLQNFPWVSLFYFYFYIFGPMTLDKPIFL